MFKKIKDKVHKILWKKGSHDIEHTIRVHDMCLYIWKKEWADLEVLKIASLLHDIWRPKQHETKWKICHAEYGAKLAKEILEQLWYEQEKINHVVHCISTHRLKKWGTPQTLEAKILFDADKLDGIWAVWVWRLFMYASEIGAKLHNDKDTKIENTLENWPDDTAYREYIVKSSKVKNQLFTDSAKQIAKKRHKTMVNFFDDLNEEIWWIKKLIDDL